MVSASPRASSKYHVDHHADISELIQFFDRGTELLVYRVSESPSNARWNVTAGDVLFVDRQQLRPSYGSLCVFEDGGLDKWYGVGSIVGTVVGLFRGAGR